MDFGLVLGLLKVSIETFQDERRDRFLKQYVKLEKEWQDELKKPIYPTKPDPRKNYDPQDFRSDLTLDGLMLELETIVKLVISERQRNVSK